MKYQPIFLHVDQVHAELMKLMSHLRELPSPAEVQEHEGPSTGAGFLFNSELGQTARSAALATEAMIEELAKAESAIRAALKDLTAHDDELMESADQLEALLDSAVEQAAGDGVDPSTPVTQGQDSASSGYGD